MPWILNFKNGVLTLFDNLVRTCKPLKKLVGGTGTFLIRKNTETVEKN